MQSFDGTELHPDLAAKAAALAFFLFVDGNKRVAHVNGHSLVAPVDFQEKIMLALASGKLTRSEFSAWVLMHVVK
jgi:death-on-curing protein